MYGILGILVCSYSSLLFHTPFKEFFPAAKCAFGRCQSSVSMTIQERLLIEKQFGVNLAPGEIIKKSCKKF